MTAKTKQQLFYLVLVLTGLGTAAFCGVSFVLKFAPQPMIAISAFAISVVIAFYAVRVLPPEIQRARRWEGAALLGIGLVVSILLTPVFATARSGNGSVRWCLASIKNLNAATMIYTIDNHDKLPPSDHWEDLTQPYQKPGGKARCLDAASAYSYAMNEAMGGKSFSDVFSNDSALLFECDSNHSNPRGGKTMFVQRHSGAGSIGYLSGKAKMANSRILAQTSWNP